MQNNVFLNIYNNFVYLQADYTGLSFNLLGILFVLLNIVTVMVLFLIFYLIGRKITLFLCEGRNHSELYNFANFALGYIAVGTGIALIGTVSLLYPFVLVVFLLLICLLSLFPFKDFKAALSQLKKFLKEIGKKIINKKAVSVWIVLFVSISFLRLIPPEIGEDAIGYHTDLPRMYLKSHTMMLESREPQHVLPIPQLGEMSYLIVEFLGLKDATRYIHFLFYALSVLLLYSFGYGKKGNNLGVYASLLFVTAPIVIRHASVANVDFQWIYCFLLSAMFLVQKERNRFSNTKLSAVLFGGVLASKLWTIAFFPVFLAYILFFKRKNENFVRLCTSFLFISLAVSFIWYARAFIITGDPFYPAFTHFGSASNSSSTNYFSFFRFISLNTHMFDYQNLVVFSPLFFLSIPFFIFRLFEDAKIRKIPIFLFFTLLAGEHLIINYYLGRYLLGLFSIAVLVVSIGLVKLNSIPFGKSIIAILLLILFFYYFSNTILALPYGFGWASKQNYLTRILSKDASSYYDFDGLFKKQILENDLVAVYKMYEFYYADFSYRDTAYIFRTKPSSFDLLRKNGVTMLFINGGDILWFCKQLDLAGCESRKYSLVSVYPKSSRYLYRIY